MQQEFEARLMQQTLQMQQQSFVLQQQSCEVAQQMQHVQMQHQQQLQQQQQMHMVVQTAVQQLPQQESPRRKKSTLMEPAPMLPPQELPRALQLQAPPQWNAEAPELQTAHSSLTSTAPVRSAAVEFALTPPRSNRDTAIPESPLTVEAVSALGGAERQQQTMPDDCTTLQGFVVCTDPLPGSATSSPGLGSRDL
jgi:hypothetical protein